MSPPIPVYWTEGACPAATWGDTSSVQLSFILRGLRHTGRSPNRVRAYHQRMKRALLGIATVLLVAACAGSGGERAAGPQTTCANATCLDPLAPTGANSPAWQGDNNAWLACDEMAHYANDGQPADGRQARIDQVNQLAQASATPRIAEQAAALAGAATSPGYQLAADVFSATCLDLGYAEAKD